MGKRRKDNRVYDKINRDPGQMVTLKIVEVLAYFHISLNVVKINTDFIVNISTQFTTTSQHFRIKFGDKRQIKSEL